MTTSILLFGDKGIIRCHDPLAKPKDNPGETSQDFEEYSSQMMCAEIDAMTLMLKKKHDKLPKAILALINKEKNEEKHGYLAALFTKGKIRKGLVPNWQLKRLIVDTNYILGHLGLKRLGYFDRKVRVSRRAMAIVKSLGPAEEPFVYEPTYRYTSNEDDGYDTDCDVVETDYETKNPVCIRAPTVQEIKKEKDLMEEVVIPEIEVVFPDKEFVKEIREQYKKEVAVKEVKSYRDALVTEIDLNIKKTMRDIYSYRKIVKDPTVLDNEFEYKNWLKNDFSMKGNKFDRDMFEILDLGGPELFKQSVDHFSSTKDRLTEEFNDYKRANSMSYRNVRDTKLREEAAEKLQSTMKATLKFNAFKILLNKAKIKEFERVSAHEKIVKTSYFKNEAIRRSMIDLEHKKAYCKEFKMDRTRKQRVRSVLDVFYGSKTVCNKRKKAYGDFEDVKEEGKGEVFLRHSWGFLKNEILRVTDEDMMMNNIEEYTDPVPFRKFTRNGVEIRHLEEMSHVKVLDEKRKLNSEFESRTKIPNNKFKNINCCGSTNRLTMWYEGLVDKLERRVLNLDREESAERFNIDEEIKLIRLKINCPLPVAEETDDIDKAYAELEDLISLRESFTLTLEEFSKKIDLAVKENWLNDRLSQEELILKEKIKMLEDMEVYNERLMVLKNKIPDDETVQLLSPIKKLFVSKNNPLHAESVLNNKNFISAKRSIISNFSDVKERSEDRKKDRQFKIQKDAVGNTKNSLRKKLKELNNRLSKIDEKYDEIRISTRKHYEVLRKKWSIVYMTIHNLEKVHYESEKSKIVKRQIIDREKRFNRLKDVRGTLVMEPSTERGMNQEEMNKYYLENKLYFDFTMIAKCTDPKAVLSWKLK